MAHLRLTRLVVELAYDQATTDPVQLARAVEELLETRGGTVPGFDGVEGVYVQ